MQAVILAAGASSRFYPLAEDRHKCQVPLLGRSILWQTVEVLLKMAIKEIILVVRKEFSDFGGLKDFGGKVKSVVQEKPLGMADALLQTKSLLKEDFLFLHGYHFDADEFFSPMIAKKQQGSDAVLLAEERNHPWEYGVLKTRADRVLGLIEKPPFGQEPSRLCVVGLYLLSPDFLPFLAKSVKSHYQFEEALDKWAKSKTVKFVRAQRSPVSLKYPWDLLKLKDYLLEKQPHRISRGARIGKGVTLVGKMIIEDGATIYENAVIKGPIYVGRNVLVGNNALIRDGTVLEENVRVGAFAEVKNSLFLPGASLGSGFVASSIIAENCRLAHGFTSANRRFDRKIIRVKVKDEEIETGLDDLGVIMGENVYTGINVGVMPGKIVGKNAVIGPGTFVFENVPADVHYYCQFKNLVKK